MKPEYEAVWSLGNAIRASSFIENFPQISAKPIAFQRNLLGKLSRNRPFFTNRFSEKLASKMSLKIPRNLTFFPATYQNPCSGQWRNRAWTRGFSEIWLGSQNVAVLVEQTDMKYWRLYQSKVVWVHDWWSRNPWLWLSFSIGGFHATQVSLIITQVKYKIAYHSIYWVKKLKYRMEQTPTRDCFQPISLYL